MLLLAKQGFVKVLEFGKKNLYATPKRYQLTMLGAQPIINPDHRLFCAGILVHYTFQNPIGEALSENAWQVNNCWAVST